MRRQVTVQVFTLGYEDSVCRENRQAAEELAEVSNRVSVEIHESMESGDLMRRYRVDSLPAIVLTAKESPELRIYGIPIGHNLPATLDGLVSLGIAGEYKSELLPLVAGILRLTQAPLTFHLDLALSRMDANTPEAAAALWRATLALHSQSTRPQLLSSLRVIEDFPRWAVKLGDRTAPALFVNGEFALSWPFKDSDILEYLQQCLSTVENV